MDSDIILFWLLCLLTFAGFVAALRQIHSAGPGWIVVHVLILALCVAAGIGHKGWLYIAGIAWVLFILLPGLLGRIYFRQVLQQRYLEAQRLARMIGWLHPLDGWWQQPKILHSLAQAQQGDFATASETLERLARSKSRIALPVICSLYRINGRWEELLAWEGQHRRELDRLPDLLHYLLRARGETGDLAGLFELYDNHKSRISKLAHPISRDVCRLMLFAFGGKRSQVEKLFAGSLAVLPSAAQNFWLATADLFAGNTHAARSQLESLLPKTDPPMRLAIERRLSQLNSPPKPPALGESIIENAVLEQVHDDRYSARPTLFSRRARATQILIVLNLLMFALEIMLGGATNPGILYKLGAVYPPAVQNGEWWRLGAALFLHFGPLHLIMNMVGLWVLAPFTELALGFRKFLFVYLLSGIGSMAFVMAFASGPTGEQITLGASGSVMGLVGATGALMLRGWLSERAASARRRLVAVLMIVAIQTAFDAIVPNVSMTAHLAGAAIGFAATMILPHRLRPSSTVSKSAERVGPGSA